MRARPPTDDDFVSENERNNRRLRELSGANARGGGESMYQTEYSRAFGMNHDEANRVVEQNTRIAAVHSSRDGSSAYHLVPGVDRYNSDDEWDVVVVDAHNKVFGFALGIVCLS
eukprot:m.902476 g.902476  ORF g.902476 m.902476 type:complete len:114 (-) comp23689_c3_seq67:1181-1522(-)